MPTRRLTVGRTLLCAGKHTHLNAGAGLPNSGVSGGYEAGWDPAWNAELPSTEKTWAEALDCSEVLPPTWTSAAGANEMRPINWVHWYDAYAYCIWSGGFLMTESERNYVATGGSEQRSYPWGEASPTSTLLVYNTNAAAEVGSKRGGGRTLGTRRPGWQRERVGPRLPYSAPNWRTGGSGIRCARAPAD